MKHLYVVIRHCKSEQCGCFAMNQTELGICTSDAGSHDQLEVKLGIRHCGVRHEELNFTNHSVFGTGRSDPDPDPGLCQLR